MSTDIEQTDMFDLQELLDVEKNLKRVYVRLNLVERRSSWAVGKAVEHSAIILMVRELRLIGHALTLCSAARRLCLQRSVKLGLPHVESNNALACDVERSS